MVDAGEVDALVPERVWQELPRGLMETRPSRMFEVLRDCGALARLLPEVDRLWGVPQRAEYHPEIDTGVHLMMVLDMARGSAPRSRCASPAWATTSARARRRPKCCRATSATRNAACGSCACSGERWRVPHRLPRARRGGGARARQRAPQRRVRRGGGRCGCSSAATRCAAPSASTTCCSRASAMRAAGSARATRRTRSARAAGGASHATRTVDTAARRCAAAERGLDGPAVGDAVHAARVSALSALDAPSDD